MNFRFWRRRDADARLTAARADLAACRRALRQAEADCDRYRTLAALRGVQNAGLRLLLAEARGEVKP